MRKIENEREKERELVREKEKEKCEKQTIRKKVIICSMYR